MVLDSNPIRGPKHLMWFKGGVDNISNMDQRFVDPREVNDTIRIGVDNRLKPCPKMGWSYRG